MQSRVWVEEWRIGDWGRPIDVGQVIGLIVYEPEDDNIAWLADVMGDAVAGSVRYEIADVETEFTRLLRGRVVAIDAMWVTYRSASPERGSGELKPVQRAVLMGGDPNPSGREVMGYLIDLETTPAAATAQTACS